jgi:crotonobetainyl-CoA:carnitine CoA-transferase CaiB-like acyl-CoA transferase
VPAGTRPLEQLTVLLVDDDVATQAAGWWLEQLGATLTGDRSQSVDVAIVRGHDAGGRPEAAATTTIVVNSPAADDDPTREAARWWLRSGLASLTRAVGDDGGERAPCLPTFPFAQGLGAMVVALMVAAYAAQARRRGAWDAPAVIEVDLLELLCLLPSQFVALAQVEGEEVPGIQGAAGWRLGGVLPTADGAVCAQAPEPAQWARLVQVLPGAEAIAASLTAPSDLSHHLEEVDRLLRQWALAHTKQEVSDVAQGARVPVTPLLRPEELPAYPHHQARGFFTSTSPRRTRLPWLASGGPDPVGGGAALGGHRAPSSALPLSGFRILDLTWAWAGPFATTLLAELGAEVVNIEWFPRPSNLRTQQPLVGGFGFDGSAWWSATQRGKSSVGINLKHDDGHELVLALAAFSDAVIDNFAPGVVDRLGIGFSDLVKVNPDIVCVSMSAFGAAGPSSHFVGYGTHLYASAGLSYSITSAQGAPSQMTIPLPDPISGIAGAIAVVAHLAAGGRARVDVSDLEATCLSRLDGVVDAESGLRFELDDGPGGKRVRFDDGTEEPVRTIAEMLGDERLDRRGFWLLDQHAAYRERGVRYGQAPWLLDGQRARPLGAAPDLFSGTHAVLSGILGLSDHRIDELARAGAIQLRPAPETEARDDHARTGKQGGKHALNSIR